MRYIYFLVKRFFGINAALDNFGVWLSDDDWVKEAEERDA